jgi:DNA-binding MarR family transcriptional regulator
MADFVESLGPAFVAHRLRRLSESLVEDCGAWFSTVGVTAPPRAASTLLLLRAKGPLSTAEIAEEVKLAPQVIVGQTREMVRAGLLNVERDPSDPGRRMLVLTFEGRKEAERVAAAARMMAEAYRGLFADAGVEAMAALEALEQAHEARPLADRLRRVAEGLPHRAPREAAS